MTGPLADVTVLEIANWVAGPSAGVLLADMGADVVKVEPLSGDTMRGRLRQPSAPEGAAAMDVPFHLDNRGKRSIAVDLDNPRGGALVRELAARADVVITNLLPARLARFGLAPADLMPACPRLVYALVTGFGSSGPDADRVAFDLTAFFARGAIMSLVAEPGQPPPQFRPGQGDHPTGLALLSAILAALYARERTGEGQLVETALLRTAAWSIGCDVAVALVDHRQPTPRRRDQAISPLNTRYVCRDGTWLNLSARDQAVWPAFCRAIGRADLGDDPRFATPVDRFRNAETVIALLDEHFATRDADEWAPMLDASGVVWAKVAELPDLVDDPQARAMGMYAPIEHPSGTTFETLAAPFTMSSSTVAVRGPAPEVGEHTVAVLRDFGVEQLRIDALIEQGVVAQR